MKKVLIAISLVLAALVLSPLLIVGFIFELVIDLFTVRISKGKDLLKFMIIGFWHVITWLISNTLMSIALGIDYLGNVLAGSLIQKLVTSEKNTMLGYPLITISAALGQLVFMDELNKFGLTVVRILNLFEKNHCENAYKAFLNRTMCGK